MLFSTASDEYDRDDFDHLRLTSDSRQGPPTLPPTPAIPSEHPPRVAIPDSSHNNNNNKCQDVRSVLNSSASFKPPSPAPRFNGFPTTPLEGSLSSFPHHVPINSDSTRPRTAHVFASTHDLATHYGIPQNFPPPPRPTHHSAHQAAPKQSSPAFDFDSIRKNYLTMLSQQPDTTGTAATVAPESLVGADPAMQAIHDLLGNAHLCRRSPSAHRCTASPEFQNLGESFDEGAPLFEDDASPTFDTAQSFDIDAYLTSPMEPPYDAFNTSPADDSPFSDFLTTPVLPSANDEDMLTGPLFGDATDGNNMSLFGGLSSYAIEAAPSASKLPPTPQLYTISPGTPSLDALDPPTTVFPTESKAATSSAEAPRTRRRTATGTRRNLKPESLISDEAPTQKRTYLTPSATSRKALPHVFAQKKRLHSAAFSADGDEEELGELSPTASEAEQIEYKRRQNTLAARKSRKRKLEHQQMLEERVEELTQETEMWRGRAMTAQDLLSANGIAFTFDD
ncbi:hypothetical protein C8R43DRAFT_886366 [Mycena crocata]|nr:hypothetical protein C8R43DRAFT_886366 [Mycena crocata]